MNSLIARNTALALIVYLLWYVLSGIYVNQSSQLSATQTSTFTQEQPESISKQRHNTSPSSATGKIKSRSLTADEIHQIMMTGRLPDWADKRGGKKLNLEEIEEIVTTGKLPGE